MLERSNTQRRFYPLFRNPSRHSVQRARFTKPRILVLSPSTRFQDFLEYLTDFEISVINIGQTLDRHQSKLPSQSTTALLKAAIRKLTFRSKLRKLVNGYDLIFCDWLDSYAAAVSQLARKPMLLRMHRHEIYYPKLIESVNWNAFSKVVAVSNEYGRLIRDAIKASVPVQVIYNGLNLEHFPFKPSASGALCTYCFHNGMKRSYDLMLALRDFRLHVGGTDGGEGYDIPCMQSAIERFGLRHVLEGYVDIPKWLHDKEYFISHSMDESFGVAFLEAMASGLICLRHDDRVAGEIVPEGYRYRYNDELVSKLHYFSTLSDKERLQHKQTLRRIVESKFDVRQQADAFRTLFLSLM